MNLFPSRKSEEAAAEERWRRSNAQTRAAGCMFCEGPAERVRRDHTVLGNVPREVWTCTEHEGASSMSYRVVDGKRVGIQVYWEHPQPCPLGENYGTRGKIDGPVSAWSCTHKTHDALPPRDPPVR